MPYIEIKARKQIDSTLAQKIIDKKISAVLTTGIITKPAKKLFDEHDVAYAENISEKMFMESEASEEQ